MAPLPPWWPKIDLENYLSCLKSYKAQIRNLSFLPPYLLLGPILTPNWVGLVLQVYWWWPSWIFKYSYLSLLKSYRVEIWSLSLLPPNLLLGLVFQLIWPSWIFKCSYLCCLKSYRDEIHNLSLLPPNLLLGPILIPNLVGLVWQVLLWRLT